MKNHILLSNKFFATIWAVFHGMIIFAFLVGVLCKDEIRLDADLFNMIPSTAVSKSIAKADSYFTKSSAQNVFILVAHEDFKKAKQMAEKVVQQLENYNSRFTSLSLAVDLEMSSEIENFIYANRYRLLPESVAEEILVSDENAESFAENALATAYSGFSFSSLTRLADDPFLLTDIEMKHYLSNAQNFGPDISVKDGVLATEYEGKWYVLIRAVLSKSGAKLASRENGVNTIYKICLPLEKDGYRFVFSGTPFHSYESSLSASREISIISTITLLFVFCILIIVFRSALPVFLSILSILISFGIAFSSVHILFGNVHMLTMVFGTSLFGCCIDYSLHFFLYWKGAEFLFHGKEIRKYLFKELFFSFFSTQICYLLLVFVPFPLLKQVAVFSFIGIASSFLTTIGIYPLLPVPENKQILPFKIMPEIWKIILCIFSVASLCILIFRFNDVRVKNDITKLYLVQGRLKEDTALSYKVLKFSPTSYFIVSGSTQEETLKKEEEVCSKLQDKYIAVSTFIPSKEVQKKSFAACEKLMKMAGLQLSMLGQDENDSDNLYSEFVSKKNDFIEIDNLNPKSPVPKSLSSMLEMLWLGEDNGRFYSVIIPSSVSNEQLYQKIAHDMEGVYFENKVKSINSSLDSITIYLLLVFALSYVVIIFILKAVYSWKQILKIACVPVISVLLILGIFSLLKYSIDFFCTVGLMLVFGLGLDYIIYMTENSHEKNDSRLKPAAVFFSFVTTELSFGALAFSSFRPVYIIGLCIALGCFAAFTCAMVFGNSNEDAD